ncbi:MAG: hypothetical protein ACPLZF_00255 [Nitrososphaeria archaeon]
MLLIENLDKIIDFIESDRWEEAKDIAKNSVGATLAVNAIKYLQKNSSLEKEIDKIKRLRENFSKLIEGKWLQETDLDYFTVLFTFFERVEKRLQETAYVKSVVEDPDKE